MPQKLNALRLPIPRDPRESEIFRQVQLWANHLRQRFNFLSANPGNEMTATPNSVVSTLTISAGAVAMGSALHFIDGAGPLATIHPPPDFTGELTLMPKASFVINSTGNITVPGGSMTTTADSPIRLLYDGGRWYVGGGLTASNIKFNQSLTPDPDGVTATFTAPSNIMAVYRNGVRQKTGATNDCVISGNQVTFNAGAIPLAGDALLADCLS